MQTHVDPGFRPLRHNPPLDAFMDEMDVANITGPRTRDVFDRGLELFMNELPAVASTRAIYPLFFNTAYWIGWPTVENPYTLPCSWWGQYMLVIGALQPAGEG